MVLRLAYSPYSDKRLLYLHGHKLKEEKKARRNAHWKRIDAELDGVVGGAYIGMGLYLIGIAIEYAKDTTFGDGRMFMGVMGFIGLQWGMRMFTSYVKYRFKNATPETHE